MQKEGDAGDGVSANLFHSLYNFFLQNFAHFCKNLAVLLQIFACLGAFFVQIFQAKSSVSAFFQTLCNSCNYLFVLFTLLFLLWSVSAEKVFGQKQSRKNSK